jgi:hypothetical protein
MAFSDDELIFYASLIAAVFYMASTSTRRSSPQDLPNQWDTETFVDPASIRIVSSAGSDTGGVMPSPFEIFQPEEFRSTQPAWNEVDFYSHTPAVPTPTVSLSDNIKNLGGNKKPMFQSRQYTRSASIFHHPRQKIYASNRATPKYTRPSRRQ